MPGKAAVPISRYMEAFRAAVKVFGRGQVSTYILAGLGDTAEAILDISRELVEIGVYPFVVPFVPIAGTALEDEPAPEPIFLRHLLDDVAAMLARYQLDSREIKAGCGRCGACSTLKAREVARA